AKQLGVSRTPLREALSRLAAEGFFDFEPGRGFFCRALEPKQVMDLYGLRAALEHEAVSLAVDHATEQGLAELEDFLQQTGSAYDDRDSKELLKIDEYFHEKLPELADNREILRTLKNVNARIRFVRWIDMDNRRSTTQNEHRQILQAIQAVQQDYNKVAEGLSLLGRLLQNAYNQMQNVFSRFTLLGQKLSSTQSLGEGEVKQLEIGRSRGK
ncbi:MAG TPA: GntR family transcriptional regulator, partial [Desulfobacterales bacterium]|nr:GntR family transcriptional regulator [Desulfobacterales bacterium]